MNLKLKVLCLTLINIGILLGFTYFTYLLFNTAFYGYINMETKSLMARDFETVEKIIENEKDNLNGTLKDW
ncbi:MAG: hypothetical protein JJE18_07730, partial [Eubacteriaceae bacterium]|nr:hypothetical protein [Eubacteriaceae bacterium]